MTFNCPNCGGDVPRGAKACPHCGSDENTGWSDRTYLDGLDLLEEDFTETLKREYGVDLNPKPLLPRLLPWVAALLAVILILGLISRC